MFTCGIKFKVLNISKYTATLCVVSSKSMFKSPIIINLVFICKLTNELIVI